MPDRALMLEFNIISKLPDSEEFQWEWYNGLNQEERQIADAAFDRFIEEISPVVLRRIREIGKGNDVQDTD
jgi:hypothetical protein